MTASGSDPTRPTSGGVLARRVLSQLRQGTLTPPGVTRASYGTGEHYAHDLVRQEAEALGAIAQVDAAGNLYLTLPGRNRSLPRIVMGSHLDTVPHGGNYDGAAGVVAGIAVIADLVEQGIVPSRDVVVMAIRAEEAAWFPLSYPGSQAALGLLHPTALQARRSDTGKTLAEHMELAGFDPEAVRRGTTLINARDIAAFVEVHIEQGPRLLALDAPIAIVSAIAGGFRYVDARCFGAYAHSGAEPRFSRRDSVLGFTDLVQGLETEWDLLERDGLEATITFGRVESDRTQHGGSRVLGELGFTLDVRSEEQAVLDHLHQRIHTLQADIAAKRNVRFEMGQKSIWSPARMDAGLIQRLEASAAQLQMQLHRMPSGAGHDAAAFAAAGVPGAMVFVRNEHGSHNPHESMRPEDLDQAIHLLVNFVTSFDER